MVREEGRAPLDPAEALRAMIALRDNSPDPLAKRLYALANPRYKSGRVLRYIVVKEAFTIDILFHELQIPRSTLYDIVNELESWAVVHKGASIEMNTPGVNPILYVLAGADPLKVAVAHKTHLELKSKATSVVVDNLRQLVVPIVDDVMAPILKLYSESPSQWLLPLEEVQRVYREEHGVIPGDDFNKLVFALAREKGWRVSIRGY